MADSIREKILQALVEILESAPGVGTISRGKIDPTSIQKHPAIFIVLGADVPELNLMNDILDRNWQIWLFVWLQAASELSEVTELFLADVKKTIMADYTLDGTALDIIEGTTSELFPLNEEQSEIAVTIEYQVKYRTQRTDPYAGA